MLCENMDNEEELEKEPQEEERGSNESLLLCVISRRKHAQADRCRIRVKRARLCISLKCEDIGSYSTRNQRQSYLDSCAMVCLARWTS